MDLFTIVGACLRRWYVTVPLLLVTVWFAVGAYGSVDPVYTSSVSIVVLPASTTESEEPATPTPDNPYTGSGGPRFAAAVLARNINTDAYRERIGLRQSDETEFEASANQDQPIIRIDATGPTPELVLDTLTAVTGQAGVVLAEFQTTAGAPEAKQYRIAPAVPADRVLDVTPSRWRSAGAVGVLGAGLAAATATGLDVLLRRRRLSTTAGVASTSASIAPTADGTSRRLEPDGQEMALLCEGDELSAGVDVRVTSDLSPVRGDLVGPDDEDAPPSSKRAARSKAASAPPR